MILRQLRMVTQVYARIADSVLAAEAGQSLARYTVLVTLEETDGVSVTVLAQRTGQRIQSVSDIVATLAQEGLVGRAHGRGRERLQYLTPAGRAALGDCRHVLQPVRERMFADFGADRVVHLADDLSTLLSRLVDLNPGQGR